jgi:hypothetical protein
VCVSEREDLTTDDDDGRKGLPQCRQSSLTTTVVAEDRTRPLYPIHEAYQALHGRHSAKPRRRTRRRRNGGASEKEKKTEICVSIKFLSQEEEEEEEDGQKFARNCVKHVRQQLPFSLYFLYYNIKIYILLLFIYFHIHLFCIMTC